MSRPISSLVAIIGYPRDTHLLGWSGGAEFIIPSMVGLAGTHRVVHICACVLVPTPGLSEKKACGKMCAYIGTSVAR